MKLRSWIDSDHMGDGFYCHRLRFSAEIHPNDFEDLVIWDEDGEHKLESLHAEDQIKILDQLKSACVAHADAVRDFARDAHVDWDNDNDAA